jgi:DNA-binding response OmpR family regulator
VRLRCLYNTSSPLQQCLAARLLIVEDDPDIGSLLAYTLQAAPYRTTVAADCELAWQILNDNSPDLVLLDWMLPDGSGLELLQQLVNNSGRRLTRKQLLDTVWGRDVYVEERTLELHIQRLRRILAPFQMAELIETVRASGYCFSESTLHSREEVSE